MKLAAKPCGGQALDQQLEEPGVVGAFSASGCSRLISNWPMPAFGDRGVGVDVHRLAGVVEIGEEGVEGVERADRQRLAAEPALARARRGRGLELGPGIVDQVEFELGRQTGSSRARRSVRAPEASAWRGSPS
jgi:hypothetical protein